MRSNIKWGLKSLAFALISATLLVFAFTGSLSSSAINHNVAVGGNRARSVATLSGMAGFVMFVCAAGATFLGFKALTTPEQPPTSATSAADDSRRTAPEGRRIVLGFGVVWLFAAM